MDTEVVIIGGGPSGLLLSQLLNRNGIATVILERSSRAHVLSRIRAGIIEWGAVETFREAGAGARMDREGIPHNGCVLSHDALAVRIDFEELTGRKVMVYGQTEITADLYAAQDAIGTPIFHDVDDVVIEDVLTSRPAVSFTVDGERRRLECAFVAGCDGFHGVSRQVIPAEKRREFERIYPFGWLGLLAHTPPVHEELIYAGSERGFALASMRSQTLSRYYIQVPLADRPDDWSDAAFWEELKRRLPAAAAQQLVTGPSIEKSIAPLRSFVSEPLRYGRLFLVGDAAHIVPPTGAKGLNLAVSDVFYLAEALVPALKHQASAGIDGYSARALARIWNAMRFSWQMTLMLHRFDGEDSFAAAMRKATFMHLQRSETARRDLAENYIGLPY
ncbi:4-hydroxybenzoate 3-monooxygenase [Martelella sp. HB161492]|uniref:4-hydroxybenzoate 3-monooxygenase n=1 Tax=Martelella sp. HB161492 TaxID=2720726 RepID=UPI001591A424|nr:4-hydroxybenzoate 3-monooxygenase [Martelella sp. HB161492]